MISPHGFGHAARVSAVIERIAGLRPNLRHHLFTTVPREFFAEALGDGGFRYHRCACDVGMIQHTSLDEDVAGTIRALKDLALNDSSRIDRLAAEVAECGCGLVVCDIAPLGLAVARRLGIPGVLIESFSWDWIYRAYDEPRLMRFGDDMEGLVRTARHILQTEPCCRRRDGAPVVGPISRRPRIGRAEVRRRLGVSDGVRMMLISMRGVDGRFGGDLRCPPPAGAVYVIPRPRGPGPAVDGVVFAEGCYHPDLVAASDLVIAKLGYSTVAEVFSESTRLGYLRRPRFPESPILEAFVREHIPSAPLPPDWFTDPAASAVIEKILEKPRPTTPGPNGAIGAAEKILEVLAQDCAH